MTSTGTVFNEAAHTVTVKNLEGYMSTPFIDGFPSVSTLQIVAWKPSSDTDTVIDDSEIIALRELGLVNYKVKSSGGFPMANVTYESTDIPPSTITSPIIKAYTKIVLGATDITMTIPTTFGYDDIVVSVRHHGGVDPEHLMQNNVSLTDDLTVFPNPATSQVNITSTKGFDAVSVYDKQGFLVLNKVVLPEANFTLLDLSSLQEGIYFVATKKNDKVISMKQIVLN